MTIISLHYIKKRIINCCGSNLCNLFLTTSGVIRQIDHKEIYGNFISLILRLAVCSPHHPTLLSGGCHAVVGIHSVFLKISTIRLFNLQPLEPFLVVEFLEAGVDGLPPALDEVGQ